MSAQDNLLSTLQLSDTFFYTTENNRIILQPCTSLTVPIDELKGIEKQKQAIYNNTLQFLKKHPCNHALLWGARGTGKSSLIKSVLHSLSEYEFKLIEIKANALNSLEGLITVLNEQTIPTILFFDDLSFDQENIQYKQLKNIIEGSILPIAKHILIYATSNRRHFISESISDNEAFSEELHFSDRVEEKMSLSDRFGLWISFPPFSQETYLEIVMFYFTKIAEDYQIDTSSIELNSIHIQANRWAIQRGGKNARIAKYFVQYFLGEYCLSQSLS